MATIQLMGYLQPINNNNFMQKIQSNTNPANDPFCPWDDDRQMELVGITPSVQDISAEQKSKDIKYKTKKAEYEQPAKAIQNEAKKTLLYIDEHEKSKKMQLLKDYVDKKKQSSRKKENELSQGLNSFKLPLINSRKHSLNLRHSSKKLIEEAMSELAGNSQEAENQDAHIFRKYGEHKKKQKANIVERSFSLGHQPFQIQHQTAESREKYETLDVSTLRDKRSVQIKLGDLQLKGKKYSYDVRTRNRREDLISYIPVQPNITPHYMLFGHNKEDILKKVLQQLHHKFKEIN